MGGAQSQNVEHDVSSVVNSITNSYYQSSDQSATCSTKIELDGCEVDGSVSAKDICRAQETAKSISDVKNTASLNNQISQQLLQKSQAAVKNLGIGLADSSNVIDSYLGISVSVSTALSQVTTQLFESSTQILCRGSRISGDIQVVHITDGKLVVDTMLQNESFAEAVNDVKRVVDQSSKATVEGPSLIALLILFAAIACAVLYSFANSGVKVFLALSLVAALAVVVLVLLAKFAPAAQCSLQQPYGECAADRDCVPGQQTAIDVDKAPARYLLNLVGSAEPYEPGLLQLAVAKYLASDSSKDPAQFSDEDFGRVSGALREALKPIYDEALGMLSQQRRASLPKAPLDDDHAFFLKDGMAYRYNLEAWATGALMPPDIARYCLCRYLCMRTDCFILDEEPHLDSDLRFKPHAQISGVRDLSKKQSGGKLSGRFGVTDSWLQRLKSKLHLS